MIDYKIVIHRRQVQNDECRISIMVDGREISHAAGDRKWSLDWPTPELLTADEQATCYVRLESLLVKEEYRGNGFGDKLLRVVERLARINRATHIEGKLGYSDEYDSLEEQIRIQTDLYHRNGYTITGEHVEKILSYA